MYHEKRNSVSENALLPMPSRVHFGDVVYPAGSKFGPRTQPFLQLVMLHSGQMTVWIDDESFYVPSPRVCILFPGYTERFIFATNSTTWHSFLHVHLDNLNPTMDARLRALPRHIPLSRHMTELTFMGLKLRDSTLPTLDAMLSVLALQVLWCYIGEGELVQRGQAHSDAHPVVAVASEYIHAHFSEGLTTHQIAEAALCSPSHLTRLFKMIYAQTPMAYVWAYRVRRGIELLQYTELAIGDIAHRCGFQNQHHFARRVRAATGNTPSEIRAGATSV